MTLARFVTKNAFRNKRRSILTMLSIAFSLFLLTFMMTLWHAFAVDDGSTESAMRLVVRHRSSLMFTLPSYYAGKMRAIPGVVAVVPLSWFQGVYKDQKPGNFFARFGTDPYEFLKVYRDTQIPDEQVKAWQRDRQGVIVDDTLAKNYGWKLGDRIFIQGDLYPVNLELNVRGIFHCNPDNKSVYFHSKYVEEAVPWFKGQAETFGVLVESPAHVPKVARAIDETFHNSPQPTKAETEKAFMLDFVTMLGDVKSFILVICLAVVFTIFLVSANTMAMSIRERTSEVAVLKALGFTSSRILSLFVGEAAAVSLSGGLIGTCFGKLLVYGFGQVEQLTFFPLRMTLGIWVLALLISAILGLLSAALPSYRASHVDIVDGLRHIG